MEAYRILLTCRSFPGAAPHVLLVAGEEGWRLPSFLPEQDIYNTDASTANQLAQAQLKTPVVTRQALRLVEPALGCPLNLWQRLRPLFLAAHQSHIVATYQSMLGGPAYLSETVTGNALQHVQWWLASHWRSLLRSYETT